MQRIPSTGLPQVPLFIHMRTSTFVEDRHLDYDRQAPRGKQASRSTAPRTIVHPDNLPNPDPSAIRSSKRPRTTSMVESVNRHGSPTRDGASSHARSTRLAIPDSEIPPPTARHTSLEVDSDDLDPGVEKTSSPTPTIPGHTSSTPAIPAETTHPASNPLDPAVADHRNRPWPPSDDRELIRYKMDTKSRPSWKTIANRLNRTTESCQARWQWLKNTHSPLLNPATPHETPADDD